MKPTNICRLQRCSRHRPLEMPWSPSSQTHYPLPPPPIHPGITPHPSLATTATRSMLVEFVVILYFYDSLFLLPIDRSQYLHSSTSHLGICPRLRLHHHYAPSHLTQQIHTAPPMQSMLPPPTSSHSPLHYTQGQVLRDDSSWPRR